jgi:tetratricopeptide (TPR) repeat protein
MMRIVAGLSAVLLLLYSSAGVPHDATTNQIHAVTHQIHIHPQKAELYLQRGELYREAHRWKEALADYDRVSRLDPAMHAVDLCRGLLYWKMEEPDQARDALNRFLKTNPDNVAGRLTRGRALVQLNRTAEALSDYDFVLSQQKEPELYLERAQILVDEKNPGEAIHGIDEGIESLGPLVTLESYAIDLELQTKNYDAALERVERVLAQMERKEMWLARKGEILEMAGRTTEAQEAFAQALGALRSSSRGYTASMQQLQTKLIEALKRLEY